MPSQRFFTNVPHDCSELELKEWIESHGIQTTSIRIIHDMVSRASPAFAYATPRSAVDIDEAISALHGRRMRNQIILVSRGPRCVSAQAL